MTWISTVLSIINNNLKPVLVDVYKHNALISYDEIKKINKRTKVIIPVNLYGGVVDNKKIKQIIEKEKFILLMILLKLMEVKIIMETQLVNIVIFLVIVFILVKI